MACTCDASTAACVADAEQRRCTKPRTHTPTPQRRRQTTSEGRRPMPSSPHEHRLKPGRCRTIDDDQTRARSTFTVVYLAPILTAHGTHLQRNVNCIGLPIYNCGLLSAFCRRGQHARTFPHLCRDLHLSRCASSSISCRGAQAAGEWVVCHAGRAAEDTREAGYLYYSACL